MGLDEVTVEAVAAIGTCPAVIPDRGGEPLPHAPHDGVTPAPPEIGHCPLVPLLPLNSSGAVVPGRFRPGGVRIVLVKSMIWVPKLPAVDVLNHLNPPGAEHVAVWFIKSVSPLPPELFQSRPNPHGPIFELGSSVELG